MLKRVTVTLPDPLASQLEKLRITERISASSVAEVALRTYLSLLRNEDAGRSLRAAGATLRRRRHTTVNRRTAAELEQKRLELVRAYEILDTPPDGAYDSITSLAANIFGVPIALVSVVDEDRIWFKSRYGLDGVQEIPREPGLCSSAICGDEPYIVESARTDPRTLANPLVAGGFGLQFYAAAPLITRSGSRLGTFCIIDREPRAMSKPESQMLQALASIVVAGLELRMDGMQAVAAERLMQSNNARSAL